MPELIESKYYTVQEIAELWKVSDDTVRNIFFEEPGVMRVGKASRLLGGRTKQLKRHWFLLRIPESVLLRVQTRLMHKRPAETASVAVGRLRGGSSSDIHAAS